MPIHWRETRLLSSLIGLICVTLLAACGGGTGSKPPVATAATAGPVTITTNLSAYSVSDAIGVTVINNSSTDYFAISGKSACIIVQLERYNTTKGVWETVDPCPSQGTAQTFAIAKNSQQQFTLAPTSSTNSNAWVAGLYRVAVTYSASEDGVSNAQQAWCAAFNIR